MCAGCHDRSSARIGDRAMWMRRVYGCEARLVGAGLLVQACWCRLGVRSHDKPLGRQAIGIDPHFKTRHHPLKPLIDKFR